MNRVNVKIKKVDPTIETVIPSYAKDGDAGLDLVCTSMVENGMYVEYGTNLAIEIPRGYVGLIFPRSSLSNYHLTLSNHVGVIDSGYRGEIKFRFKQTMFSAPATVYQIGDKIGQLIVMPYPRVLFEVVDELDDSARGNGGFGSSGK